MRISTYPTALAAVMLVAACSGGERRDADVAAEREGNQPSGTISDSLPNPDLLPGDRPPPAPREPAAAETSAETDEAQPDAAEPATLAPSAPAAPAPEEPPAA